MSTSPSTTGLSSGSTTGSGSGSMDTSVPMVPVSVIAGGDNYDCGLTCAQIQEVLNLANNPTNGIFLPQAFDMIFESVGLPRDAGRRAPECVAAAGIDFNAIPIESSECS